MQTRNDLRGCRAAKAGARCALFAVFALAFSGACNKTNEELMKELTHESPVRRAGAVRVLWKEGTDDAYTLVTKALADPSPIVRVAAVRSLADFTDRDTTAALIRATRDADPEVRRVGVAKLAEKKNPRAQAALLGILLRGESDVEVRGLVREGLKAMGLTAEGIAKKLAASQIERIREDWEASSQAQRVGLIREAGHSVHPGGVEIVIEGLAAADATAVLTAIAVLDGRGGRKALKALVPLVSDRSAEVRLAAVQVLKYYGPDGLAVLEGALRDMDPRVRQKALESLLEADHEPDEDLVCSMLDAKDFESRLKAARLLREGGISCPLDGLQVALDEPGSVNYRQAIEILAVLGGKQARDLLRKKLQEASKQNRLRLVVALARAGDDSKEITRALASELETVIDTTESLFVGWVTGKLPPAEEGEDEPKPEDDTRLSEKELKELYEKHGLDPSRKGAPRGVGDILAAYEDDGDSGPAPKLFDVVTSEDVGLLCALTDALARAAPGAVAGPARRCLSLDDPELVGEVAAVLLAREVELELDEKLIAHLAGLLNAGEDVHGLAIAGLLGRDGSLQAAEAIAGALAEATWERREGFVGILCRLGKKETVEQLQALLKGYSAASAAKALGLIGDRSSVEPLKKAMQHVGPSAELDILMALARLGETGIAGQVISKLDHANPAVRLRALLILDALGEEYVRKHAQQLRYDLDRHVRREALRLLGTKQNGDGSDDGKNPQDEGRGGRPAVEGKTQQGTEAVPAGDEG